MPTIPAEKGMVIASATGIQQGARYQAQQLDVQRSTRKGNTPYAETANPERSGNDVIFN